MLAHALRIAPRRPALSASLAIVIVAVTACGGAHRSLEEDSFRELLDVQRSYATDGASSADWVGLAESFGRFRAEQPSSPYIDDALVGEAIASYYADRRTSDLRAVDALTALLSGHPDSPHAPNALYWLGRTYERLGDPPKAHTAYTTLVRNHPSHAYARAARHALGQQGQAATNGSGLQAADRRIGAQHAPVDAQPAKLDPTVDKRVAIPTTVRSLGQEFGLGVRTIVIDPGHGGKDPGAYRVGAMPEKQIALHVAIELAQVLSADGFDVRLTRDSDVFVPLRERNTMARKWGADLFISVHVNDAENAGAHGIETWVGALAKDAAAAAVAARENFGAGTFSELPAYVAELLANTKTNESRELARCVQTKTVSASGAADRGIREAGFVVLLGLRVPSVLVELGFSSNPGEAAKLASADYRRNLAHGLASGVRDYVSALTYVP